MRGFLLLFTVGVLAVTGQAAPLIISGTGALTPSVAYNPGYPQWNIKPSLTYAESFADIPQSLNTAGTSGYIQLTLSAPENYEFTIAANTVLSVDVSYVFGTGEDIGFSYSGPMQVSCTGLRGNAPDWVDNSASWSMGFSFSMGASVLEEFSFTSLILTVNISGTGLDSVVTDNGDHSFSVQQANYTGSAPPNETQLIQVTAVPEPASLWLVAAGVCGLAAFYRRK